MSNQTVMLSVSQETSPDLFNAIFQRDWAAVGGWSLFIGVTVWLLIYIPRAFANEKIVPGAQHRRQVEANVKLSAAVDALTQQNGQLITANEITKHFFQETTPKRGEATEWDTSPVERRQSMGQTPTL